MKRNAMRTAPIPIRYLNRTYMTTPDIRAELRAFKERFDKPLAQYMDEQIENVKQSDTETAHALHHAKNILCGGGKRLRPALAAWSYVGSGGKSPHDELITRAGIYIELIHLYLLIHDDIMDRDDQRHGVPTIHTYYRDRLQPHLPEIAQHMGESIALIIGDMVNALGSAALFTAPGDPERIISALRYMQETIVQTAVGQSSDMRFAVAPTVSPSDVLRMYRQKTAHYTIATPLILGSVLARGDDPEVYRAIMDVALPLGTAFQIRDDIIGLFGTQEQIGKPVGSDISEGKMTFLLATALERATDHQRATINALRGTDHLTPEEIATFCQVITDTGARAAAEAYARTCVQESLEAIARLPFNSETRARLSALSDYIVTRIV